MSNQEKKMQELSRSGRKVFDMLKANPALDPEELYMVEMGDDSLAVVESPAPGALALYFDDGARDRLILEESVKNGVSRARIRYLQKGAAPVTALDLGDFVGVEETDFDTGHICPASEETMEKAKKVFDVLGKALGEINRTGETDLIGMAYYHYLDEDEGPLKIVESPRKKEEYGYVEFISAGIGGNSPKPYMVYVSADGSERNFAWVSFPTEIDEDTFVPENFPVIPFMNDDLFCGRESVKLRTRDPFVAFVFDKVGGLDGTEIESIDVVREERIGVLDSFEDELKEVLDETLLSIEETLWDDQEEEPDQFFCTDPIFIGMVAEYSFVLPFYGIHTPDIITQIASDFSFDDIKESLEKGAFDD